MSLVESSPALNATSLRRLSTCDQVIQDIVKEAAATFPMMVVCGHRTQADQDAALRTKHTKLPWPQSSHNSLPSRAVDLAPLTPEGAIDWKNTGRFIEMARHVLRIAKSKGVDLRWGGDWDGDGVSRYEGDKDETFVDMPHFELSRSR